MNVATAILALPEGALFAVTTTDGPPRVVYERVGADLMECVLNKDGVCPRPDGLGAFVVASNVPRHWTGIERLPDHVVDAWRMLNQHGLGVRACALLQRSTTEPRMDLADGPR